jgi:hypothetical protein
MNREFYILWYRLDQKDSFLVWFSTENDDGVLVDENGFVPSFKTKERLLNFCAEKNIRIKQEEPILHNLDIVQEFIDNQRLRKVDCPAFNSAWNLFEDISNSINGEFDSHVKSTKKIYEKLFWGLNLPAVTPEGKSYEPSWTKQELKIIRETLKFGFQMFAEKVKDNLFFK